MGNTSVFYRHTFARAQNEVARRRDENESRRARTHARVCQQDSCVVVESRNNLAPTRSSRPLHCTALQLLRCQLLSAGDSDDYGNVNTSSHVSFKLTLYSQCFRHTCAVSRSALVCLFGEL